MPSAPASNRPAKAEVLARNPSREEMALREVGHTDIRRPATWTLVLGFLLALVAIPVVQHVDDIRARIGGQREGFLPQAYDIFAEAGRAVRTFGSTDGSPWRRLMAANRRMLQSISEYEDELEDRSVFSRAVLPPTQAWFARLGGGNEDAYVGRGGWLFYRPDMDYLTGPGFLEPAQLERRQGHPSEWQAAVQPDPLPAIRRFRDELEKRGIALVLVPTPSKASIHPRQFSRRAGSNGTAMQNPSFDAFVRAATDAGVLVFDPTPILRESASGAAAEGYLATDTHWRPEAMQKVVARLADFLSERVALPDEIRAGFRAEPLKVENLGDVATMLRLPAEQSLFSKEQVVVRQVIDSDGGFWRPDPEADVLLLGDSFSNIYSLAEMGWGESAGFAEHLALALQRPVDCILRNDAGSHATRELLARDLRRGKDRLAGKRVVVWQFAVRELAFGDWREIALELGSPREPRFIVPPSGETWTVSGIVESVSAAPRPGSVPYKDHIVALRLSDVKPDGRAGVEGDALVYLWSMQDNVWTPAARLRSGMTLRLRLRPWADAAAELDRFNRSELADETLQLEEPCWGEWADK